MPAKEIIHVEQLTKYYGKAIGVENIDFTINEGEIFGFLGPNGAGKTTTIRMLLHLLHATSGNITIFGESVKKHSVKILKRVGYLPGEFEAYGQMTGADYLAFTAAFRNVNPDKQKELIERFKMNNADLQKRIKQLSHGNLQKLGIIQAFFHKPDLLILDEPTTGLDPLMQSEFYKLVQEYQRAGSTIFFSSHNLPEVERICSRIAIIRDGTLVALETLEALKKKRYRRMHLTLKVHVEKLTIPQTQLLENQNLHYTFLVKGEIKELLKHITKLPVENIVFPEADLEDVFMAYYGGENND